MNPETPPDDQQPLDASAAPIVLQRPMRHFVWTIVFPDNKGVQQAVQAPNLTCVMADVLAKVASEQRKIIAISITEVPASAILKANGMPPPFPGKRR